MLSGVGATPFEYGATETLDISRSGVRLKLSDEIKPPMLVQMHIQIPNRSLGLFLLGKIVYCSKSKDSEYFDAGIKFVGLLPPDLDKLDPAVH